MNLTEMQKKEILKIGKKLINPIIYDSLDTTRKINLVIKTIKIMELKEYKQFL